jgi:hypothetical protein
MKPSRLRGSALAVVLAAISISTMVPAKAAPEMQELGTDAALDGPPAADVVSLAVARESANLHVRITLSSGIPVQGSYPDAGIEWSFDVKGRTFVAEGHPEPGSFTFTLFEVRGDVFNQVATIDGSFDALTGFMDMYVPLRLIGAKRGTRISGAGPPGTEDVDIHQHLGPAGSPLLDTMATSKDYVVP